MKLDVTQPAPRQDVNMVPLINIVFLLLVFFMIAGQIERTNAAAIEPLLSSSTAEQDELDHVLVITQSEELFLNGDLVPINLAIERLKASYENSDLYENRRLLIKADANLLASTLREILANVHRAGISHISLATIHEAENLTDSD